MASSLFGWDLLYKSVEQDIKKNQDVLVLLTHLVLVSNNFQCIGLGESKIIDGNEPKSEALPQGWTEEYAIRYVYQGRLYNLKGTNFDDGVMINLIRVDERSVSLVQLNARAVAQRSGTLGEMIPDNKNIVDLIKKQLIDKVIVSKKMKENSSQTEPARERDRSRMIIPDSPGFASPHAGSSFSPIVGPSAYGRSDLDPFGGMDPLRVPNRLIPPGGGGMLFQPPTPTIPGGNLGVPPGSIPPGARFDPFRPPESNVFPRRPPNRPDNDEFPPPGYEDMFM